MIEPENGSKVTFTVKELLVDMNKKLDGFFNELALKASASDLVTLTSRVAALEETDRIALVLEGKRDKGLSRFQTWVVIASSFVSTAAIAVTALSYFHL